MNKKADFVWSKVATIILILVLLVILLFAIYFLKDNMYEMWSKIVDFMRFSG